MRIKNIKITKFLIILVINIIIGILIIGNGLTVLASEKTDNFDIYNKYTPDVTDDFEGNKIIVTLTKDYSDVNKPINYSDFESDRIITMETINNLNLSVESNQDKIVIKNICDLTFVNNPNIILEPEEFIQIFSIELMNNNKENVLKVIEELEKCNFVIAAEPLYNFSTNSVEETHYLNDSEYDEQWGLHGENGIQAEDAWELVGNGKVTPSIRVGIFETNMQMDHPDLDTITGSFTPATNASAEHGTHVAGIIGAISDNEIGISGVAQVQIGLLDRGPAGELERTEFIDSLVWAIENNVRIANASFAFLYKGSNAPAQASHIAAIQNFGNQGGILICAAGNAGKNNDNSAPFPAGYADSTKYPQITNVISVGSIDKNGENSSFSNFGANSVQLFAPGGDIYSTYPNNTYVKDSGTSMAAPHVTGVAALLLSINKNLTVAQIREAILNSVTIPNINGSNPLEDLCVTNGRLNAYNAVKYVLEHFSNTEYTLSNYRSTINTNKIITDDESYFDELNGFYKLNVTYDKSYEFISSSASGIKVTLYDDDFTEISYNDLDSTSNKVHFIQNLSIGTYYLRVSFASASSTGTINTKIISRNTAYLSEGENDVLINTYNNDDEYNFINHNGPGFYKFSIEATKADGSVVTYPYSSLKIYDHMNSSQEDKYNVDGYSELAQSIDNNNYLYMYLERNGYYYIHVNMLDASYTSVKLNIERVSVDEIEVAIRFDEAFTETLINSNDMTEYATGFSIDQTSVFTIDVTTSQTYTGNITFILFRKAYNNDTKEYYIDEVVGDYIPLESDELRKILVEGTYYIGFFGNTSNVPVTIKINRIVTTSEITDQVLVMDIDENLPYGTEVRHNGGEYGEKTITEGFTRHIHFLNVTGVPSVSRYDYSFYSSNKNYATVSEFGTVFAKSVTGDKTVTITAVYKYDPAIIFTIELTILDDTSNTEKVIETTQTISLSEFENGKYKLVLDENNSPYPWIQYYNWSVFVPCQADDIAVTIDNYGFLTTNGVGCATLTGTYSINPNVTLIIHINFVE